MSESESNRLHARIQGRVQGVGFRMFVLEQAQRLDLTGWVRNTWDNAVEVTAEGPRDDLEILLKVLKSGPPAAYVTNVEVSWEEFRGEFSRFVVSRTE